MVVAQVSRGGGHAEVVAGGQPHSILESTDNDLYNGQKANLLKHKAPRRACWRCHGSQ